jgi:hypothetical protein
MTTDVQGWEVWSTLHSNPASGSGDKQDFSLAQALRRCSGKDWVLIGRLMLLGERRCFVARQAALINSDGEIVHGSEIEVPTDDPSLHKVIEKKP